MVNILEIIEAEVLSYIFTLMVGILVKQNINLNQKLDDINRNLKVLIKKS